MKLEDLNIYNLAMEVGDDIWIKVIKWDNLSKYSIGQQVIRSSDSIAANISEGFGRFHYNDRKRFMYYSRGSLFETKTWLVKAKNRNLIDETFFKEEYNKLNILGVKLNNFIATLNNHQ